MAFLKKQLKLNIKTDDGDGEDDTNSNDTSNNKYLKTPDKNTEKIDYNRGQKKDKDKVRLQSNIKNDIDLIKFYITSSNKDYDFSYHWFEKCNNLNVISESIQISLNDPDFTEPIRDYSCEFELLKLITEDNYHRENLIELPRSLKRYNRYSDIIPCKLSNFIFYINI